MAANGTFRRLVGIAALTGAAIGGSALVRRRETRPEVRHGVHLVHRRHRTAEMARVGGRVGRRYAVHRARKVFAGAERREVLDREFELRTAADVTSALGNMKGALMKLGQMASYLDDGLPEPVREALASLQSNAPPMSPDLAAEAVERELGLPPDHLFEEWDEVPIAAASIGQVHRAITRDGRPVAVKVQYPGVDRAIRADLDNSDLLFNALGLIHPGFEAGPVIDELRGRIVEELDYEREARNQRLFADYYDGHPFIHVPKVIDELCTARVLTTELASGARLAEVLEWTPHEKTLAAETIYRFVFRSIYQLHAFNGDPHPGNYLFAPGGRVTFLDFGLVKTWDRVDIEIFEDMVKTIALDHDGAAFKAVIERANILKPGSGMGEDEVFEYFGQFYLPVLEDAPFTFTHEFARKTVQRLLLSEGTVAKYGNVPPNAVIIQRINVGLYSILADLEATANWRRIAEELWPFTDGPPSTALGEEEQRWLRSRGRARSVPGVE